jgi:uronate dehydrogenase
MTILITGASGTIGVDLAHHLAERGHSTRLFDRRPFPQEPPASSTFIEGDLRNLEDVLAVTRGAQQVIHLGGVSREAGFPDLYDHNILGTYHVLEAARQHGAQRVVLASSNHVTGLHSARSPLSPEAPAEPDSFYGVSKTTLEALGYLYAHKTALTVVCARIGSYLPAPAEPRHAATWLSPRDGTHFLENAALQPLCEPYLVAYATSNNPVRWWPRAGWEQLKYQPVDCADSSQGLGAMTDRWQGGVFATAPIALGD